MIWDLTARESVLFTLAFFVQLIEIGVAAYIINAIVLGKIFKKADLPQWQAYVPVCKTYSMINAAFTHKRIMRIITFLEYIPVMIIILSYIITAVTNSEIIMNHTWLYALNKLRVPMNISFMLFSCTSLWINYKFISKYSKLNKLLVFLLLLIPIIAIACSMDYTAW